MEKERLEYTIGRLDHYFDSVNNKTAVYIAINTFITGGVITLITQIKETMAQHFWLLFVVGVILLLGIFSLIILALASIPYISPNTKIDSLYYFGSIGDKKFSKLTWVGILLIAQFILLAPLTYLLISKLL